LNRGWRFCRFRRVLYLVDSSCSLVSGNPSFWLVVGPSRTEVGLKSGGPGGRLKRAVSSPSVSVCRRTSHRLVKGLRTRRATSDLESQQQSRAPGRGSPRRAVASQARDTPIPRCQPRCAAAFPSPLVGQRVVREDRMRVRDRVPVELRYRRTHIHRAGQARGRRSWNSQHGCHRLDADAFGAPWLATSRMFSVGLGLEPNPNNGLLFLIHAPDGGAPLKRRIEDVVGERDSSCLVDRLPVRQ
jgi:hypothetical protein